MAAPTGFNVLAWEDARTRVGGDFTLSSSLTLPPEAMAASMLLDASDGQIAAAASPDGVWLSFNDYSGGSASWVFRAYHLPLP